MKDNQSFGGEDEREESDENDLENICDSLRDDLLSDQMSDCASLPANAVDRDIQAKPIANLGEPQQTADQPELKSPSFPTLTNNCNLQQPQLTCKINVNISANILQGCQSEPPKINVNTSNDKSSAKTQEESKQLELMMGLPRLKKIGTANPHISVNQLYQTDQALEKD